MSLLAAAYVAVDATASLNALSFGSFHSAMISPHTEHFSSPGRPRPVEDSAKR
jgi:hypothetical protein